MEESKWYLNRDPNRGGWVYRVYDVSEPDRTRYGGKTQVSVKEREAGHWYDARRTPRRSNSRMVHWLAKRDSRPEDVVFEVVSFHETLDELNEAEIRYIAQMKERGQCDLNIATGGEGAAGVKWSEESKRRKRETAPRGENHPNAKVTWAMAHEIRELSLQAYHSHGELASRFDLHKSTIDHILRNKAWIDPLYDPTLRVKRPKLKNEKSSAAKTDWGTVKAIREARKIEWFPLHEAEKRFGVKRSTVSNILRNVVWEDPDFDPADIVSRSRA